MYDLRLEFHSLSDAINYNIKFCPSNPSLKPNVNKQFVGKMIFKHNGLWLFLAVAAQHNHVSANDRYVLIHTSLA
jgi:hypothetical protein